MKGHFRSRNTLILESLPSKLLAYGKEQLLSEGLSQAVTSQSLLLSEEYTAKLRKIGPLGDKLLLDGHIKAVILDQSKS